MLEFIAVLLVVMWLLDCECTAWADTVLIRVIRDEVYCKGRLWNAHGPK